MFSYIYGNLNLHDSSKRSNIRAFIIKSTSAVVHSCSYYIGARELELWGMFGINSLFCAISGRR